MSNDPRHRLGQSGEDFAAAHLLRLGYEIVARNHRTRFGELDVVAVDGTTLVFCEVKTRRTVGTPFESLHQRKRARVRRMAAAYLAEQIDRPRCEGIRFDAIGVVLDSSNQLMCLDHLEAAF